MHPTVYQILPSSRNWGKFMVVDRVLFSCTSIPSLYRRRFNWRVGLEGVAVACDELRNGLAEADLFCVLRFLGLARANY